MRPFALPFILLSSAPAILSAAPGDWDTTFNDDGNFEITVAGGSGSFASLALEPNGRIYAAGARYIVCLQPDGTLDTTFSTDGIVTGPGPDVFGMTWRALELQTDGKLIACGVFNNSERILTRWNADGTPDSSFNGTGKVTLASYPYDLALDSTGAILVATGSGLKRFTATGQEDLAFGSGGVGLGETPVYSVDIAPGGNPVFAGTNSSLVKLSPSGIRDEDFPGVGSGGASSYSVAFLSGNFYLATKGITVSRFDFLGNPVSALNGTGVLFTTPITSNSVAVQRDGKIFAAGTVDGSNGFPDFALSRYLPDGSPDTTFAGTGRRILDYGNDYTRADAVIVQPDGKPVVAALVGTRLTVFRFQGDAPDITVEYPEGQELAPAPVPAINFGPVPAGQSKTLTVFVSNSTAADLEGVTVQKTASGTPGDFSIGSGIPSTLATGDKVPVSITFTPASPGQKSATLEILSNDPDESPFTFTLSGRQATASDLWRQKHFGTMEATGSAADLSDPDSDGIPNLMEFATGTPPNALNLPVGELVKNGNTLEFTYWRSKAAVGEVSFIREFSQTISGTWSQTGGTVETILEETADRQKVMVTTSAGSAGKRFVRLRVSRL